MTVDEFRALPDEESKRLELHEGEVFEMTRPKWGHGAIQRRLIRLLEPALLPHGDAGAEISFRPSPEHNLWAADVAFVRQERIDKIDPRGDLFGAPDIVIEVESPSNTAAEFERREIICLRNGCAEFWIVYPALRTVRVTTKNGRVRHYEERDTIELTALPGAKIAVSAIFG